MKSWNELKWFKDMELGEDYPLKQKIVAAVGDNCCPPRGTWYRALELEPNNVKVVILGQDPYPTPGDADGLAFSCNRPRGKLPGTLRNILQELNRDLHLSDPPTGDLSKWADQGVLLLNTALTVGPYQPGSHVKLWEPFADEVISELYTRPEIVWILWGNIARRAVRHALGRDLLDRKVITSPHPSPLSAERGFFGSRPFSRCNALLLPNQKPIDWRL